MSCEIAPSGNVSSHSFGMLALCNFLDGNTEVAFFPLLSLDSFALIIRETDDFMFLLWALWLFQVEAKFILARICKMSRKHESDSVDEYQICRGMMLCQVAHKI